MDEIVRSHEDRLILCEQEFINVFQRLEDVDKKVDNLVFKIFGMLLLSTALTLGGFYITVRTTVKDVVKYEVFNQIAELTVDE